MASKKDKKPPQGKELDAEDYLAAAKDHANALTATYENGDYALTVYVSGVAVECLFRAFRDRRGLPFRSDHQLTELAEEAGFPGLIPERDRERFDAALADIVIRWRNNHRFRSKEALRRFLKGLRLDRGIKRDFLKENARRMSSGAIELIGLGVDQW